MSDKIIARAVDIKGTIKTIDLFPETNSSFNMNLIWSNSVPEDKFSEQIDGALGRIKETILSCLYGENQ